LNSPLPSFSFILLPHIPGIISTGFTFHLQNSYYKEKSSNEEWNCDYITVNEK
jgi:hypothetical protein